MRVRDLLLASAITLATSGAVMAANDYAFVDKHGNRQALWSSMAQCDNDTYNEPCESLAICNGTTLYSAQSKKYLFYDIYNTGGTVYVYYAGSSSLACSFTQ